MAKNKKTVGFTMVENDLLKVLFASSLTSSQVRIILFIIYQTMGYHREEKMLTINYISNGTGIPYSTVRHSLTKLKNKRIINISYNEGMYRIIKINKNFCQWDLNFPRTVLQLWDSGSNNFQPEGETISGQGDILSTDTNTIKKKTIKNNTIKSSKSPPPPAINDVISFCKENDFSFSGEKFFYHYQSLGWTYNGQPIADWKALAEKWQATEKYHQKPQPAQQNISAQSNSQFQAQAVHISGKVNGYSTAKATGVSYDLEAYEKYSMFDD